MEDKEKYIKIELLESETKRFFYTDHHHIQMRIMNHCKELLGKNLVIDNDGDKLK